jgi:hypothetical protein
MIRTTDNDDNGSGGNASDQTLAHSATRRTPLRSMSNRVRCRVLGHKWLTAPFTDPAELVCRQCGKATISSSGRPGRDFTSDLGFGLGGGMNT